MQEQSFLIMHAILWIAPLFLVVSDHSKKWPELVLLAAIYYSYCAISIFKFLNHELGRSLGDLMLLLIGGGLILWCVIIIPLLIFRGLATQLFSTRCLALILALTLGYATNLYLDKPDPITAKVDEYLDEENPNLEAQNRALEEGIDPKSLKNK